MVNGINATEASVNLNKSTMADRLGPAAGRHLHAVAMAAPPPNFASSP
jgi:hypothetical protein